MDSADTPTGFPVPLRFYDLAIFDESPDERNDFVASIDRFIAQTETSQRGAKQPLKSNAPLETLASIAELYQTPRPDSSPSAAKTELEELRELAAALTHGDLLSVARDILDEIQLNILPDATQLNAQQPNHFDELLSQLNSTHEVALLPTDELVVTNSPPSIQIADIPGVRQLPPNPNVAVNLPLKEHAAARSSVPTKFLIFSLGASKFALRAANLSGIERHIACRALPNVPPWITGLGNFNGQILPILNLEIVLQYTSANTLPARYLLIREDSGGMPLFALKVEAAHEIASVPEVAEDAKYIEHAGETLPILHYQELWRDPVFWRGTQIMASVNEFDM